MGWAAPTAYSHAQRLEAAGWLARCQTTYGGGSLLYATAAGTKVAGVDATPLPRAPAPTTWLHCRACAWTAAWLTSRGRVLLGPRELLAEDSWHGELVWRDRIGSHRRMHRPDLAGGPDQESLMPIEVELTRKSKPRLRAVLGLHAAWVHANKIPAVVYVCANRRLAARVRAQGVELGLCVDAKRGRKTLRVELLEDIREQALAAREFSKEAM
jgi:hypothetical protein